MTIPDATQPDNAPLAALVETLGDARAADGETAFLAIPLLGQDAGDVPEAVGEPLGEAGRIAFRRNDSD